MISLVVQNLSETEIVPSRNDLEKLNEFIEIYCKRFESTLITMGYRESLIYAIFKKGKNPSTMCFGIFDAYSYFLEDKYNNLYNFKIRFLDVSTKEEFLDLLRTINALSYNTLNLVKEISRYESDRSYDFTYIRDVLDDELNLEEFRNQVIMEPTGTYLIDTSPTFNFYSKKKNKRRERAEKFLEDFLLSKNISKEELMKEHKLVCLLVKAYRTDTDLSFRDIGYVLNLSHTTIIRIYNNGNN